MIAPQQDTPAGGLGFERTVPRSLAHRRCVGEVFVTDTASAGSGEYLAAVQIPRTHLLWSDRPAGLHNPLALVEAVRQTMTVVGHRYLNLPPGTALSLQRAAVEVEDRSALHDDGATPLEGIVQLRTDLTAGSAFLTDHGFTATVAVGGAVAVTVHGGGVAFPAEAYADLRRHQRAQRPSTAGGGRRRAPVAPARVGRRDARNVVIADGPDGLELVVDQRHPAFFNHPYDHVPGPLLLEGFRQAALLGVGDDTAAAHLDPAPTGPALVVLEADFTGFAEFGAPLMFTTRIDRDDEMDSAEIHLELIQFGARIAGCRIDIATGSPESWLDPAPAAASRGDSS
ncbi:AfsA-related hotdog domain-containing protein [Nocardia crassostreae]|uniref:AfsA-related hotdog domain-containing protein n=1 Tax=Nocardia crassostreae TaxID=53428 RepID=UPI0008365EE4|nr:AfsA-related hotdog domain-containing protein [Nocardia crassostreae]